MHREIFRGRPQKTGTRLHRNLDSPNLGRRLRYHLEMQRAISTKRTITGHAPWPRWLLSYAPLLLALAPLASACRPHQPTELDRYAQRRLEDRGASLRFVVNALAKREAESPAKLRAAADFIVRDIARDAQRTSQNATEVEAYLRRDLERWIEHQDDYLREAARILWGQPEAIPRTAIILFL